MIFNVEFAMGQTLVEAKTQEKAYKFCKDMWGNYGAPYRINEATEDEINWVKSFGGVVHYVE